MKERYNVLKHIYQNYLILIIKNNKYYTFDEDKLIFNYLKRKLNNFWRDISWFYFCANKQKFCVDKCVFLRKFTASIVFIQGGHEYE